MNIPDTMTLADALAGVLRWPGERPKHVEIDGVTWDARLWNDDTTSINDFDCYGRISDAYDYWRDGRTARPDGFTGAARKIEVDRGLWVWWEPYRDGHKVYDSPGEIEAITRLLQWGFHGIVITATRPCECCKQSVVVGEAALFGLDHDMTDSAQVREAIEQTLDDFEEVTR